MKNIWQQLGNHYELTPIQEGRVRERVMRYMKTVPPLEARGFRFFAMPRVSPVFIVGLVVMLIGGSGATAVFAKDSNPYDTLYPVRVLTERARARFARSPEKRAELALKFSEIRLNELRKLAEMQAASEGRARVSLPNVTADKRLAAFTRSGKAIQNFSNSAEKYIATMRAEGNDARAEALGAHLDAVLDASLGILQSVEVGAPAEEPVRAVVVKAKKNISSLESKNEMSLNQADARFLEKITASAQSARAFANATSASVKTDETADVEDDEKKEGAEETRSKNEVSERAQRKIAAARSMIETAARTLEEKQKAYGNDVFEGAERALKKALEKIERAEMLVNKEEYRDAFAEASEAMRTASHVKVYAPVADFRTKVQVTDDNELRLHILPTYKEDYKPTTTTD